MSHSVQDSGTLEYIITHVFCPLRLPGKDDHNVRNDRSLAQVVATAASLYSDHVGQESGTHWDGISRMLKNLYATVHSERLDRPQVTSQFTAMGVGDVLPFLIRAQNAGVIFRKQKDVTLFEAFELSPKAENVMAAEGKLICSYPGPAIEVPNSVFDDTNFLCELVNFLVHMNEDKLDVAGVTKLVGVPEFRDTVDPHYITELLTGILRSVGRPADVPRISKRVGDDVVCDDASDLRPWRRSSLWLLIRVTLQTTLDRSPLGHFTYKEFMLFFMCRLAEETHHGDLPSDLLHFMSAKISRRLQKLGSSAPDWLSRTVLGTCTSFRSTIEVRWGQVQTAQCLSPTWAPSQLDLTRDIQLSLLRGRDYLHKVLAEHGASPPDISFSPKYLHRGALDDFLSLEGAFFEDAYRIEPHVALYDVEKAVEQGIDAWVGRVRNNDEACVKLEILADKYSSSALKTYANNPELLSVMLLTTIELWVALDKIAVKKIPILANYSPEVPTSLLENLLLCEASGLDRVRRAHQYLSSRHSQSRDQWSVFSSTPDTNSFPVRFYKRSSHLQRLKTRVEEVPQREVREKIAELREKNARHFNFQKTGLPNYTMETIDVYVWPLPVNRSELEAVVFELDCPISFNMWRTATLHLLVDLCSVSARQTRRLPTVDRYPPLQPYLVRHPRSRTALGFRTSFPPRSYMHIPAKRERVCLNAAMEFVVFDTHTGIPLPEAMRLVDSDGYGTYKLASGRYQCLQKYVNSTSHTSNEVIANQAECPEDLSIHEYMAFAHLRSGGLLQWFNILRELRGRTLSLRCPEVHMLLAQAASQVGPLDDTGWAWHQEVKQDTFCYALLQELRSLVQAVEVSWREAVTMDTISFLLRRLLISCPDDTVSLEALDLLLTLRGRVFVWVRELLPELQKTPRNEETCDVLRDIAVICRSTFHVEPAMVPKILHSAEDIEVLLTSAIIINLRAPGNASQLPAYSQLLLDRDRRLSLFLEPFVSKMIQTDTGNRGVNLAIRRIWPDYIPGSKWTSIRAPDIPWFSCTTAPPADRCIQAVYLNILDGSLLVDGKSFGTWLPREFARHPLYSLIFGERMLEVLPSDLPGMGYATCNLIYDHQVYLSLRNKGSDLVIQAKRSGTGDSDIIQLIPHKELDGDLPAVLIEEHAHWLNLSTSIVEIRPLDKLWETSAENWRVDYTPGDYRVWRGREFLVDIRSQSWGMVSTLLEPLSSPKDLIVTVNTSQGPAPSLQLSVVLLRYNLSFFVDDDGDLQSRDVRGMVYDKNQSIGTLFGLVNKLVLRPKIGDVNAVELVSRCVLIPHGRVSFQVAGHHVRIEITPSHSLKRLACQIYSVNTDMGCLTGNGSLTSRLYCAYMHALTNGCSADPLTGRSGTEEALSILRSGGCWSTMRLSSLDSELLTLIASICPSLRRDHKESMRGLPANPQNPELYITSKAIKEHYERVQRLYDPQLIPLFQGFPSQDGHLLKRTARRVVHLFPSEASRHPSGANSDLRYSARDLLDVHSREYRACVAAMYVFHRTVKTTMNMQEMMRSLKKEDSVVVWSLRYSRSWLHPDLPSIWFKVYNLLREHNERKWFQLLFSIPAMAYASPDLSDLVHVFVSFASQQEFCSEDPPHSTSSLVTSQLEHHFTRIQTILNHHLSHALPIPDTSRYLFQPADHAPYIHSPLKLDHLFSRHAPSLVTCNMLPRFSPDPESTLHSDFVPLHQLISTVGANAENPFQRRYVSALRTSAVHLEDEDSLVAHRAAMLPIAKVLVEHYALGRASYFEAIHYLQRHLGPGSQSEWAVGQSGQWPRITAYTLFRCLASNAPFSLPDNWKKSLTKLALLALELQRARRMLLLHFGGLHEELSRELQNEGCDGWNAESHPDWLLIQLQGNFLIRPVQAEVANEMISPLSGENTAMQLNMGEGKTSVIIPIVAATLANGQQLVRVIAPKPLIAQTLQLLADRLGGLTNRRIYHFPLSRALQLSHENVVSVRRIMLECMQEHGILVVQPDHILLLKLLSVERQLFLKEDRQAAHLLLEIQRWLHSHSRDVLDESDETLDVQSQLVFTIGHEKPMEGAPDRWTTTQRVLGFVSERASSLRGLFPFGVEYEPGPPGSFPRLRILQADAGKTLVSWVIQDVLRRVFLDFTFGPVDSALRDDVRHFISCEDVPLATVRLLKKCSRKALWNNLLLLRGILSNGILLFALSEWRWRVDYGLSLARTTLAVPYRAKDVPAERAEYGHPDIAIILTCLSYYYGGLNEEQLKLSFEILFTQFDPSLDYETWVRSCPTVPEPLRSLSCVNVDSAEQWNKVLFPLFSRNRTTIDFYLAKVVFPKRAREFPSKISSSGWDLVEKKENLLTGFSGTNDGQYLLPLHISQRDAEHQRGTNARVLSQLLRSENNHYMCVAHANGERRTARELLQILVVQKPEIRVLLDVGSQILDLKNYELAGAWLEINPGAFAAIYFSEEDELMVRTRDGNTQFLRSSPFAQQIDRCVVYLDDAHTRGTDIKFPSSFRAAVTLGPRVTKDRLVQGCMRMRMLGRGQSIMFFAPLEVDRRIRSMAGKDLIGTSDILHWSIRETWEYIRRWGPQWAQQGIDHQTRYTGWSSYCNGQLSPRELLEKWVQPEAKSLEELYLPHNPSDLAFLNSLDVRQHCIDLGIPSLYHFVGLDEEQEREFAYKVLHERQVELSPRVQPANHYIHPDVIRFVKTGVIPTASAPGLQAKSFKPAFEVLDSTSAVMNEVYIWSQSVLVTTDFEKTVKTESGSMDSYLRPVHWIVSAKRNSGDLLVVFSPYEVNCLLPDIRSSKKVHLHVYTPRIMKAIKSCDDLSLYNIPRVPDGWTPPSTFMDQLSVFAGQLYLKDYESYTRLCRFLGLYTKEMHNTAAIVADPDGFIQPKYRQKCLLAYTFQSTPTADLTALMNLRSRGADSTSTHMGKLLRGQLLSESDFDG